MRALLIFLLLTNNVYAGISEDFGIATNVKKDQIRYFLKDYLVKFEKSIKLYNKNRGTGPKAIYKNYKAKFNYKGSVLSFTPLSLLKNTYYINGRPYRLKNIKQAI